MSKRTELNTQQRLYADWLALVPQERSPKTYGEMASMLEVSVRSLYLWEKDPAIIQLVSKTYEEKLINLVGPATDALSNALKNPTSITRVAFDCAKYIVQDWAKKYQGDGGVVKSIADLYKKYN